MTSKLYHISFAFPGVPKMRDLEPAFSDAGDDWIRISATVWVVYTAKGSAELYYRVIALLDASDQFLITQMTDFQTAGRLPQWAWDWINAKVANSIFTSPPRLPPPSEPNSFGFLFDDPKKL